MKKYVEALYGNTLQAEKQLDSTGECIPRICKHIGQRYHCRSQYIEKGNREATAGSRRVPPAVLDTHN